MAVMIVLDYSVPNTDLPSSDEGCCCSGRPVPECE